VQMKLHAAKVGHIPHYICSSHEAQTP
jgi:hypothetical protein